jgi:BirA family biotin operon repressor/biotin-[acetyl-CoA-carboxylase] ligase
MPGQNLTCSVLLRPAFLQASAQFGLSMAVALSVHDMLCAAVADVQIKWPNDVLVGGKKIAGILIESAIKGRALDSAVVGVGINIGQRAFSVPTATSLSLQGCALSREEVAVRWLGALERRYLQLRAGQSMKEEYLARLAGMGIWLPYRNMLNGHDFDAKITGIDEAGRLLLLNRAGEETAFAFKEVGWRAYE